MNDPREFFLHELGDLLYAENVLVKALPKLADEATDDKLRAGFEAHLEETKQHVKNVEKAFSKVGEKPSAEKCPAIDGIKAEHDTFMKDEAPSAEICDLFLTGSGAAPSTTRSRPTRPSSPSAKALGESEVATLLEENLRQEEAALGKLESIAQRLAEDANKPAAAR
jgi:ferritin-like metal-binding protein YciE